MKTRVNGKRLLVYLAMPAICGIYILNADSDFGFSLLLVLLIVPLISYLFLKIVSRRAGVEMTVSRAGVYKGETVDVRVTVRNGGILPIPFFEARIQADENLACESDDQPSVISIPSRGAGTLTVTYTAKLWGTARVSARQPVISDLIGLFRATGRFEYLTESVSVRPNLCESGTNELMTAIQSAAVYSDKGQHERASAHSLTFEPGYDHRPYEPGDPLKRMNWKLSAKRDEWLIRNLEFPGGDMPMLVLDPCRAPAREGPARESAEERLQHEERIVEGFLSMLLSMHRFQTDCEAHCLFETEWRAFSIRSLEDIEALQDSLSAYSFQESPPSRLPARLPDGGFSSLTVFSCLPDAAFAGALGDANLVCADFPHPSGPAAGRSVWRVDRNYDIYQI